MPIYIYETIPQTPGEEPCYFEFEERMTDEPLTTHPETGVPLRRTFRGGFSVGSGRRLLRRLLRVRLGVLRVTAASAVS